MVDTDFKEPDEGGSSGNKITLTTIIIIAVIAIVMGAGGFFAGKIFSGGDGADTTAAQAGDAQAGGEEVADSGGEKDAGEKTVTDAGAEGTGEAQEKSNKPGFLALDTFTVNLNDPFGKRYVECILNLVLNQRKLVLIIKENQLLMARVRHEIFMTISAKSFNDLKSTAGKITLFEEIQMRVNEILKQELDVEPVIEVLQTKFLMQ